MSYVKIPTGCIAGVAALLVVTVCIIWGGCYVMDALTHKPKTERAKS